MRSPCLIFTVLATLVESLPARAMPHPVPHAAPATDQTFDPNEVLHYIHDGWHKLLRSNQDLLKAAMDPKHPPANGRWPVYISATDDAKSIEQTLRTQLTSDQVDKVEIRHLSLAPVKEHGILYLPNPYIVPGGRFNEMYGWDSYFIILGLLHAGELKIAVDMTNNFLYEIEHYGSILNANRTYYLNRSHPPFLTRAVLRVFEHTKDKNWLRGALPTILKYEAFWNSYPRLTDTGLSRFYDSGQGPAPEVVTGEIDKDGMDHFARVRAYYKTQAVPDYDVNLYYDATQDRLTDLFYRADRAMRESGFDPSGRFGPFNAGILAYNPVCLNSLLVVEENDLAQIYELLGDQAQSKRWADQAAHRAARINELMWDEKDGLYYDYDFTRGIVRRYPFATTFYPMWAGVASKKQAAILVENLKMFRAPGGLLTSTTATGTQWDRPYGWAPPTLLAIEGLRRYGYNAEAEALVIDYLGMMLRDFQKTHALYEKYDVLARHSDVSETIKYGYAVNVVPFGMSNATFLDLYEALPPAGKAAVIFRAKQAQ